MSVDSLYFNRELSWLSFNSRVLAQAEDRDLPLLERLKFCAIYSSNLDEFFMVRVAGLMDQIAGGVSRPSADGRTPSEQVEAIADEVRRQALRLERAHVDRILPALAIEGINVVNWDDISTDARSVAADIFDREIYPVLTPLAVDPGHPFPYISNRSLNLAVLVTSPGSTHHRFARLKVPDSLPRFVDVGDHHYVPLEQVMTAHLDRLFPGMDVVGAWAFRVTRNADIELDDGTADDLLEAVEVELRRRRFGQCLRLEIDAAMNDYCLQLLLRELELSINDVYSYRGILDTTGYWQLVGLDRPDLQLPSFTGQTPDAFRDLVDPSDFFKRIANGPQLVHHPYDSFGSTITRFIRSAADDADVLAIKLTLYRTSGDSPIVEALIRAAESGKQVAVLVELKARFDEQANIGWAKRLEDAGCHVIYGIVGLKIHTKIALAVRRENGGLRRYCHVGTGNYNSKTASIYEDLGLLTCAEEVGRDLSLLFNFLTGYGSDVRYARMLVAPQGLRPAVRDLIRNEAQAPRGLGHIVFKLNSLVDPELIDELYAASQVGVRIDLIVRGICCLRPGVPGLSENIRVRSIVGRYLEHSRVLYFANGDGADEAVYYIGSADLMPRNLDRRVEALAKVVDPGLKQRLSHILQINLDDDTLAWELDSDGTYHRQTGGTLCSHQTFEELAVQRSLLHHDPMTEDW